MGWLCERGLVRAADSLGRMLGYPVRFVLREVQALACVTSPSPEGVAALPVAGVLMRIGGEGAGRVLLALPLPTVFRILQTLVGTPAVPRALSETERSAVGEVGNVVVSSFVSELGDRLGRRLVPSPPEVRLGDYSRLVNDTLAAARLLGGDIAVVHGLLEEPAQRMGGGFLAALDVGALEPRVHGAAGERGVSV
jgi:chemotaxis protein CheC